MKKELKHPKYSLESHEERFGTEEKCRQYIAELRWENGVPTCPHKECRNMYMNYYISSRKVWYCSKCKKQFSITKGTIFESSNLPLTLWFKAIYYFTIHKRGLSSCQLSRNLGTEQRTAWFILHRLREALNNNDSLNLDGEVEVDETFIAPVLGKDVRLQSKKQKHDAEQEKIHGLSDYKKRKLRGYPLKTNRQKGVTKEVIEQRKIEKALLGERKNFEQPIVVFGILQRNGKIHLEVLGKGDGEARKENIFPIIKRHVTSKSIIVSDQSSIYKTIKKFFGEHQYVNHSKGYVIKGIHINGIENVFKHLKKMIKGTFFHIKLHHFQNYLFEHSFRWNVLKKSDREKVDEFFPEILGKRLKYGDLISRTFNPLNFAA